MSLSRALLALSLLVAVPAVAQTKLPLAGVVGKDGKVSPAPYQPWMPPGETPGAKPGKVPWARKTSAPFQWDIPGVIESIEMPANLESNGVPVQVRAVRSTWSMDALFGDTVDKFTRARLYIAPEPYQPKMKGGIMLTGLNVDTSVAYTIILQPNPDKTTTAILGESYPARRTPPDTRNDFAPLFPGGQNPTRFNSEDARSLDYTVVAKPDEVKGFYADVLPRAGYLRRGKEDIYVKDGQQIRLRVRKTDLPGEQAVGLNLERADRQAAE